ncbi:MAG: hypothetical protein IPG45_16710 [Deltaproteobacteria bacterium]|nr:hypothetical protein [Deltaproteobacteria bacterium]
MRSIVPDQFVHRGTVVIEGWWLHHQHLSPTELERRAFGLAAQGARLFRMEQDFIALLPRPEVNDTRHGPGSPLVRIGDGYSAVPLSSEELGRLHVGPRTLVVGRSGRAELLRLDDLSPVDPKEWLEPGPLVFEDLQPLGDPPVVALAPVSVTEVRQVLGLAPGGPAGERRRLLAALKTDLEVGPPPNTLTFWEKLRTYWQALFPARGAQPAGPGGAMAKHEARLTFKQRLRQALTSLALRSRLFRLFGRRQAQYLADMLSAFERGDLDAALKTALPLADLKRRAPGPRSLALGVPQPRGRLGIELDRRGGGGSSMVLADELYAELELQYRRAFERLDREGRHEEAAFVLTELLQQHEEAVDYLERHGRLLLSAELAEARELPPGLVIRQWALAGDWERALGAAVKSGAFADGILRLERAHPELAKELRERWALILADAGELPLAIDVLWPLPDRRHLAKEWVNVVLEAGGPPAARMLLRAFELDVIDFGNLRDRAVALLEEVGAPGFESRMAFTHALLSMRPNSEIATLARPALRSLYRDQDRAPERARKEKQRLERLIDDPVLRADLPPLPAPKPRLAGAEPRTLRFSSHHRGAMPILDVARLSDGRMMLALGEAGSSVYDRHGRLKQRYDEPAHHLVPSDRGARVITLAPRDAVFRLARMDLVRQRVTPWGNLALTSFAHNFDGWRWFVGRPGKTVALDVMKSGFETLWSVDVEPRLITRTGEENNLNLMGRERGDLAYFHYGPPGLQLRSRQLLSADELGPETVRLVFLEAGGRCRISHRQQRGEDERGDATTFIGEWVVHLDTRRFDLPLPPSARVIGLTGDLDHVVVVTAEPFDTVVRLYSVEGQALWSLHLEGEVRLTARFFDHYLVIGDDHGRVVLLDTTSLEVVSSFLAQV